MVSKTAIVTGASGQDGSYMCELLSGKGYTIHPIHISRVSDAIDYYKPDEFYNFAGVSDVINPFLDVAELMEVNLSTVAKILTAIEKYSPETKLFQASSCLIYGPYYPYGISKLAADALIIQYREKFGIYACSGIFYPHESPRRKNHFFSKKVINAALNKEKIKVGNLSVQRDYGYAPDYMEAAWLMLQQNKPKDYEIGRGSTIKLINFVKIVFDQVGLDYRQYITENLLDFRFEPIMVANPEPIFKDLGWKAKHSVYDIIEIMLNHERTTIAGENILQ